VSRAAYRRAERCFALARSTTFKGEREAAVALGTDIATKAGLSLDEFDIPGRQRTGRPIPERLFEGSGIFGANFEYVRPWIGVTVDDLMRDIEEPLRRTTAQQQAALRAERERRRLMSAIQFLRGRGCRVASFADGTFVVDNHHAPSARVTAATVIMAAQSRGWKG
jgi:hypothetical protein